MSDTLTEWQKEKQKNIMLGVKIGIVSIVLTLILITLYMWIMPRYSIYKQRLEGQALLAHAQSSKEVAVAEAKAKMESASLLAEAEVARAKGVAQANDKAQPQPPTGSTERKGDSR